MIETGEILEIHDDGVVVTFKASDGCAKCDLNHCCQTTGTGNRQIKIHVQDHNLSVGDSVEIKTATRSLLLAAFLVFILPLVLAFGAYALLDHNTGSQTYSLIGFFVMFIFAEVLVAIFDRIWGKKKYFEPEILNKI